MSESSLPKPVKSLDLRQTKCPLNFVQTKLALEKLALGQVLEVWILSEAESALNIPKSIAQEGHTVIQTVNELNGSQKLWIERCK
ncbi:MAG: sulfurtransferase TusA family protein [Vampirovibrio sp.]|nr:sulfurtransferase TusA family protein [Vampirovibrio sp.]